MHRTNVPAPPHTSQLPREVKARAHHKQKVVQLLPSARPARLPWGGLMGSYDFYHGCPSEHPLKMGEDYR